MKILHTADWHLGLRLMNYDRQEEHELFLSYLLNFLKEESIDVLLVSGDIFDSSNPPTASLKQYYNFLAQASQISSLTKIIITGGNHDSPSTLNAPKELLGYLNIEVVGSATEKIEDECFLVKDMHGEEIWVAAIPFLRDKDVRLALPGETDLERQERLIAGIIKRYEDAAAYTLSQKKIPLIGMGHLFAAGSAVSDSELTIHVGNLGAIQASRFPKEYDYLALGHIHKPQRVGGTSHIRYSGSPLFLSFSEAGDKKQMLVIEVKNKVIESINEVPIPFFRKLIRISGNRASCISQVLHYQSQEGALTAWAEVSSSELFADNELNTNENLMVIKTIKQSQTQTNNSTEVEDENQNIEELQPQKIFEKTIAEASDKEMLTKLFSTLIELNQQSQ